MRAHLTKGVLALAITALTAVGVQGQYNWDVGVHLGGANYLGEMGGKDQTRRDFIWDMKLGQTRWAVGPFARYKINRTISVNAGLLYMRIQGADANSTNPQRVGRNLNFRNDMFELYVRPEFTIFQDNDLGGRGRYRTDFRLFGYVGAAVYYHNPKGQINRTGDFYALQPLTTELVSYSKWGFAVPAGLGFHFTMKRRHRIGFDFGWRTTFTDYLDDVSTDYQNPALMPEGVGGLADQLADQSLYVLDLDLNAPGVQQNPDLPSHYQYGWEENDSDGRLNKRGDPTHNDSYLTMTFTYSYVLKGQSNFYRQRYSWVRGKKRIGRKSRAKF
ncbi:MAG: outer membrane beta-barrel protein [Flavobacteriales bacterium]|nr:outer membrane beta-barrel protein [Flavobacteriales bacterium]MBK9289866.1 outer membrane beta-barrel protein [Flavobacteriales bacterium]MBL0036606.1 outer membrane beta-barrel protein [Flavobacteriales bacterium]